MKPTIANQSVNSSAVSPNDARLGTSFQWASFNERSKKEAINPIDSITK
jgi:hypothetical protein